MTEQVKILFEIPGDDPDSRDVESVWAVPHHNGYMLDNIPFYAKGFSYKDVISVNEFNGQLYADELIAASGHSTVRIWFSDEKDVASAREELNAMGCSSEISDLSRLVAVDIPPEIVYEKIQKYLVYGESTGKWDYEEACLGFL